MSSNFNNKELLTKLKNILNVYNTAFGAAVVPPGGAWVINPGFQNNTGNVLPIGSGIIRYPFKNNNNDGSTRFWLPFLPTGVTEGTMGPAESFPDCTGTPPDRGLGSPCCAQYKDNDTNKACIRFVVEIDHPKLPEIKFGGPPHILRNPRGILGPIWISCTSIVVNGQAVIQCNPLDPVNVVRVPPKTPSVSKPQNPTSTGVGRPGGGFRGRGGGLQP